MKNVETSVMEEELVGEKCMEENTLDFYKSKDISLRSYIKFLWKVLRSGGIKVWASTTLMHLLRIVLFTWIVIYFNDTMLLSEAAIYGILIAIIAIPVDIISTWALSIHIRKKIWKDS